RTAAEDRHVSDAPGGAGDDGATSVVNRFTRYFLAVSRAPGYRLTAGSAESPTPASAPADRPGRAGRRPPGDVEFARVGAWDKSRGCMGQAAWVHGASRAGQA